MMTNINEIEATLRANVPADLHAHIPHFAELLAAIGDGTVTPSAARSRINTDRGMVAVLEALRALNVGDTTIKFGDATNIAGNVGAIQSVTQTT
jgi:hypothetical protein